MNNETGACLIDFDNVVTFSVSVTLEDCMKAKEMRYAVHSCSILIQAIFIIDCLLFPDSQEGISAVFPACLHV